MYALTSFARVLTVLLLTALFLLATYIIDATQLGKLSITPLENINGIPYPVTAEATVITESLAHTDVLLESPSIAKSLVFTVRFLPGNADRIGLAVRENSFWFSYQPTYFYDRSSALAPASSEHVVTITVPITDKIQDKDSSLDVMFFAENKDSSVDPAHDRTQDTVSWYVRSLEVQSTLVTPTSPEIKDYIKRIVYRERPL